MGHRGAIHFATVRDQDGTDLTNQFGHICPGWFKVVNGLVYETINGQSKHIGTYSPGVRITRPVSNHWAFSS